MHELFPPSATLLQRLVLKDALLSFISGLREALQQGRSEGQGRFSLQTFPPTTEFLKVSVLAPMSSSSTALPSVSWCPLQQHLYPLSPLVLTSREVPYSGFLSESFPRPHRVTATPSCAWSRSQRVRPRNFLLEKAFKEQFHAKRVAGQRHFSQRAALVRNHLGRCRNWTRLIQGTFGRQFHFRRPAGRFLFTLHTTLVPSRQRRCWG